jgi:hypothetical protein
MSAEDRCTFDRWLKANVAVGLVIAAGLIAMALAGSAGPGHGTVAKVNAPKARLVPAGISVWEIHNQAHLEFLPVQQIDDQSVVFTAARH